MSTCKDSTNDFNYYYNHYLPIWIKQRDSVSSEEHIKQKAWAQSSGMLGGGCKKISSMSPLTTFNQYLRPTESMITSETGSVRYSNYLWRAKWYPYPLDTHDQALGLINTQPATIELSSNLEYMENDATSNQESLETVLSCINSQQIVVSRVGVLAEVTENPSEPYNLQIYNAESITDWRVSLDKNGEERPVWIKILTDECIDDKPVYFILFLDDSGIYSQYKTTNQSESHDNMMGDGLIDDSFSQPKVREKSYNKIPFVTINASRLGLDNTEKPWLQSISDCAFKTFQASATYEDTLFWGGQSTFCATGYKKPSKDDKSGNGIKLGNGGAATSSNDAAKFYYASAGTDGIEPNRANVEALKNDCKDLGVDLINQGVESGVALETRLTVKTASLKTLAMVGAEGLDRVLKMCAEWVGDNPEDVNISANTEFSDRKYTAEELEKLAILVRSGNFLSVDYYNILKRQKLTSSETFEDWDGDLEAQTMTGDIV